MIIRYAGFAIGLAAAVIGVFAWAQGRDGGQDAAAAPPPAEVALAAAGQEVVVYKSPTCGCCQNWVEHLEEHGFAVKVEDTNDLNAIKAQHGVPQHLQSCHTAIVDGKVIEGHVPADLIARFLTEDAPDAGLAVPGMPIGSPGMEQGPIKQAYDVIAFGGAGGPRVYASR